MRRINKLNLQVIAIISATLVSLSSTPSLSKEPNVSNQLKEMAKNPKDPPELNFNARQVEILINGIVNSVDTANASDLGKKSNIDETLFHLNLQKQFFSCKYSFKPELHNALVKSFAYRTLKPTDSTNKPSVLSQQEQECPIHKKYNCDVYLHHSTNRIVFFNIANATGERLTNLLEIYDSERRELANLLEQSKNMDNSSAGAGLTTILSNFNKIRSSLIALCGKKAVEEANL